MSAQHTPGPWRVSELDASGNVSEYYLFIEPGVAVIERKVTGQDEHDLPDARLIAAAPDLLELLERAVRRLEVAHQNGDSIMREWVIDARVALAKATGSAA